VDLLIVMQVLWRRRLLMGALFAVAALVVGGVYLKVPPTYQVTATLLVLPPSKGGVVQTPQTRLTNPYLSFDSSTYILARVLTQSLGGDAERATILARGGTTAYQVATSADEPIVTITVTDHDRARVVATLHTLVDDADTQLAGRQQATGLPRENWAGFTPVVIADAPTTTSQRLKVVGGAAALAAVAALGIVLVVESVSAGRRRRVAMAASITPLRDEDRRRVVSRPGD
jgi:hypothetical protein